MESYFYYGSHNGNTCHEKAREIKDKSREWHEWKDARGYNLAFDDDKMVNNNVRHYEAYMKSYR